MARLVLVNGMPATGKSTLARRYAQGHALTLALDLDVIRSMLGRWQGQPEAAGHLARAMALEMVYVHLVGGRDVLVPQLVARTEFISSLQMVAERAGALFVEVLLDAEAQDAVCWFSERSQRSDEVVHQDAAALVAAAGGPQELLRLHRRLAEVVTTRPGTRRIPTVAGDEDGAYLALCHILDGG